MGDQRARCSARACRRSASAGGRHAFAISSARTAFGPAWAAAERAPGAQLDNRGPHGADGRLEGAAGSARPVPVLRLPGRRGQGGAAPVLRLSSAPEQAEGAALGGRSHCEGPMPLVSQAGAEGQDDVRGAPRAEAGAVQAHQTLVVAGWPLFVVLLDLRRLLLASDLGDRCHFDGAQGLQEQVVGALCRLTFPFLPVHQKPFMFVWI